MDNNAIESLTHYPKIVFNRGEYIVRQGQAVEYIYYLAQGHCVRNAFTIKGDEIIYDEFIADNSVYCLLGALTLYSPIILHETNFIAKTTCICYKIYYKDFFDFLSANPSVLHELLYRALSSYHTLNANFQAKQKGLAAARVCSFILENAKNYHDRLLLEKKFTISEISRYLGMHRVTVNKIVLTLCDENILRHTKQGLLITDKKLLEQYATSQLKLNYLKKQTTAP